MVLLGVQPCCGGSKGKYVWEHASVMWVLVCASPRIYVCLSVHLRAVCLIWAAHAAVFVAACSVHVRCVPGILYDCICALLWGICLVFLPE